MKIEFGFKVIPRVVEPEFQTEREACIKYYGLNCQVCGMNFEDTYGEIGKGKGYIHVHHEVEISTIAEVDPIVDLKYVSLLHTRKPAYTIEQLRNIKNSL